MWGVCNPGIRTVDLSPFGAETDFLWRFRTESVSEGSTDYSPCAEGMLEPSFSTVTLWSSHEEQIHLPAPLPSPYPPGLPAFAPGCLS